MQSKIVFLSAVQRLRQAGIPGPELEASLLLSHTLAMKRTEYLLAGERRFNDTQLEKFEKLIRRRLAREPLAYLIGEKEFWSLPFKVSKDVLIPRPETELLLEKSLEALKSSAGSKAQPVTILDLGTGSGVIAIVLALELVAAKVTAIDRSYSALKIARHNAKKHKIAEKINFINCSWFDGLQTAARYDAVISNPPYIAGEIFTRPFGGSAGSLQPEVGKFEPRLALDGGEGGMQAITRIAAELGNVLKSGGWFFLEIGADQQREVFDVFRRTAAYDSMEIFPDYAGLPRVFQARKK